MFLDKVDDLDKKVNVNAKKNAMRAVLAMSDRNIVSIDFSIVEALFWKFDCVGDRIGWSNRTAMSACGCKCICC